MPQRRRVPVRPKGEKGSFVAKNGQLIEFTIGDLESYTRALNTFRRINEEHLKKLRNRKKTS